MPENAKQLRCLTTTGEETHDVPAIINIPMSLRGPGGQSENSLVTWVSVQLHLKHLGGGCAGVSGFVAVFRFNMPGTEAVK